ncbi:hypothetical protein HMPREF0454_00119 [Hafnia alvei ATCC 51873]|uniref:Uncharacterized protein n=1 Tax=Hafnia alvei ATCC 51873 TaxID=1002364 RepID=G9Y0R1_HAFAL|nr:hypothetical protein HMPREF0454_00119 [Hafnia alvei ATCC 51873]
MYIINNPNDFMKKNKPTPTTSSLFPITTDNDLTKINKRN